MIFHLPVSIELTEWRMLQRLQNIRSRVKVSIIRKYQPSAVAAEAGRSRIFAMIKQG